jgi:hypothetical protein
MERLASRASQRVTSSAPVAVGSEDSSARSTAGPPPTPFAVPPMPWLARDGGGGLFSRGPGTGFGREGKSPVSSPVPLRTGRASFSNSLFPAVVGPSAVPEMESESPPGPTGPALGLIGKPPASLSLGLGVFVGTRAESGPLTKSSGTASGTTTVALMPVPLCRSTKAAWAGAWDRKTPSIAIRPGSSRGSRTTLTRVCFRRGSFSPGAVPGTRPSGRSGTSRLRFAKGTCGEVRRKVVGFGLVAALTGGLAHEGEKHPVGVETLRE